MKDLMTKRYCDELEPNNVESESHHEIYTDIKDNTVVVESDSEITVQKQRREKDQSFTVAVILKWRNLTLKKRRGKKKHSLSVTSSQTVNPETSE